MKQQRVNLFATAVLALTLTLGLLTRSSMSQEKAEPITNSIGMKFR